MSVLPVGEIQSYYSKYYGNKVDGSGDFGKGDFFKLISAQLKYQNPLSPMNDVDFMSQTAQFNLLEQVADLNNRIQYMVYSQDSLYASSLINKEITWVDENLQYKEGLVEKVVFSQYGPLLIVDGMEVSLDLVVEVSEAAADNTSG